MQFSSIETLTPSLFSAKVREEDNSIITFSEKQEVTFQCQDKLESL